MLALEVILLFRGEASPMVLPSAELSEDHVEWSMTMRIMDVMYIDDIMSMMTLMMKIKRLTMLEIEYEYLTCTIHLYLV